MELWRFFFGLTFLLQIIQGSSQQTELYSIRSCDISPSSCSDSLECGDSPQKSSCSCHPSCHYFNDCCYDVDDYFTGCTRARTVPDASDSLSPFQFNCTKDEVSGKGHWMVASCPSRWEEETDSCSGENITVGRFGDGITAVPVTSSTSGVTFSNVFCALCNAENLTDLQPWALDADCEEDVSHLNMSAAQLLEFVLSNCLNLRFAPAVLEDQLKSNYLIPCPAKVDESLTNTCPGEGDKAVGEGPPDAEIFRLCEDVHAPLQIAGQWFRNKDCAECHLAAKNATITLTKCREFAGIAPPAPDEGRKPIGPVLLPISVVLTDFDQLATACSGEEVYDEITGVCRQLFCPSGYELLGNLCTPSVHADDTGTDLKEATPDRSVDAQIIASFSDGPGAECSVAGSTLFYSCLEHLWSSEFNRSQEHCTSEGHNLTVFEANITYTSGDILVNVWYTNFTEVQPKPDSCSLLVEIRVAATGSRFEEASSCQSDSEWLEDDDDKIGLLLQDANKTSTLMIKSKMTFTSNGNVTFRRMYKLSDREGECNSTLIICPKILLDASEFSPMVNDSDVLVYTKDISIKLTPDKYTLRGNDTIEVCNFLVSPVALDTVSAYQYSGYVVATAIGSALSITSLIFCLVTYGVFPSLRSTISTFLTMVLCMNLLIAAVSMLLVVVSSHIRFLCSLVAWAIHFFYLAVFSTSSLIGAHFIQTFQVNLRSSNSEMTSRSLALNLVFCYGIPALISVTLVSASIFADWDVTFGDEQRCLIGNDVVTTWAFLVPCGLSVSFNMFAFIYVVVVIFIQTRGRSTLVKNNKHKETLTTFLIFLKISAVLGLTWLFGFLGTVTKQPVLLYIFDTMTPFQGFFIFLAFMCRRKTWRLWKQKLSGGKVAPGDLSSAKSTTNTTTSMKTRKAGPEIRVYNDVAKENNVKTEITCVD